jgi:hypothetical protein
MEAHIQSHLGPQLVFRVGEELGAVDAGSETACSFMETIPANVVGIYHHDQWQFLESDLARVGL